MTTAEKLEELQEKARKDPALKKKLLAARPETDPLKAFCQIGREAGCEIYPMDIVCAGEEFYAAIRRSTNGGGENSPLLEGEDDFYELFFAGL